MSKIWRIRFLRGALICALVLVLVLPSGALATTATRSSSQGYGSLTHASPESTNFLVSAERPPASAAPPSRWSGSLAYDPADGYLVMFGGRNHSSAGELDLADTWIFAAGVWKQLLLTVHPSARDQAAMTFDHGDGYLLLFGGYSTNAQMPLSDTWTFVHGVWKHLKLSVHPSARYGARATYDGRDDYVLLFGGTTPIGCGDFSMYSADTWEFHAGHWTKLAPAVHPAGRGEPGLAYDRGDGYAVLFGGVNDTKVFGDTWVFRAGEWSHLRPAFHPPADFGSAMAYDPADGYALLFGGSGSLVAASNETWKFTDGSWAELHPSPTPNARVLASLAFDSAAGYAVLFGNVFPGSASTWIFLGGDWSAL